MLKKIKFQITKAEGGTAFPVHVLTGGEQNELLDRNEQALSIRLAVPDDEDQDEINAVLRAFIAETLNVSAKEIEIAAGHNSCDKMLVVFGLSPEEVEDRLFEREE